MGFRNWIKLSFLVLLTRIFFVLIIKNSVIGVTFTNAVLVAFGNQPYESFL